MQKLSRTLIGALLLAVTAGVNFVALAQTDVGRIRFMHAIPAASAIDIYTDGQLTVSGLSYGSATQYIQAPAGEHTLTVTPSGLTTTLWQQPITVSPDTAQTLVAVASDPLGFTAYREDLVPLAQGNTRLAVAHAVAGGPTIDVLLTRGDRIIENLQAGQTWGPADVPANVYDLVVVEAGGSADNAIIPAASFPLSAGTSHLLVIYGPANSPTTLLLSAPVNAEEGGGFVRLVNGVAGGAAVDIYLNDSLVAPALQFGVATEHIALPAGTYAASVRSGDQELASADLEVKDGGTGTVVVMGTPDDISVNLFPDDTAAISPDKALLSVINSIPGNSSVSVTLEDGTVVADQVAFGDSTDVQSIDPTRQVPTVTLSIDEQSATLALPAQTFYGGVYYNGIALDGTAFTPPTVVFIPTSLAEGLASAPGAAAVSLVSAVTPTTEPAVVVVQPTSEPQVAVTTAVTVQVATQPPAAVPTPTGPSGRVLVNPDANLNLREYPSAEARNLTGIPSNTIVLVNGREGAPEFPEGVTPQPAVTPFVDPATLITDPKQDLSPDTTWLNVTYNTPDGGTISGWVNALYIEVRNTKGELQRLADLPTVPNNRPGEARNTALTPPPIPKDRVIVKVFNLNPDARLNIRRTPDTAGERLEGIANDTPAELVGLGASGSWAFIRYLPTAGGTITGWVSTQYIEYYFNDRKVTLDELNQRGLLVTINDDLATLEEQYRGGITGGAQQGALPTPNPIKDAFVAQPTALNPDASLNLRRTPDVNAEVVAKIPASTAGLIVTGRTQAADWLQTSFEGQRGWISSQYVTLTFNGRLVDVNDVPVAAELLVTPEATPTTGP